MSHSVWATPAIKRARSGPQRLLKGQAWRGSGVAPPAVAALLPTAAGCERKRLLLRLQLLQIATQLLQPGMDGCVHAWVQAPRLNTDGQARPAAAASTRCR